MSATLESSVHQRQTLVDAFQIFQRQCEQLEVQHQKLQAKLDTAHLRLEQKNRELAQRVIEIGAMKERLSGILESIDDAVYLIGDDGQEECANGAATELKRTVFADCGRLAELPAIAAILAGQSSVHNQAITVRNQSYHRSYLVSAIAMTVTGQEHGRMLVLKDVSEQRRLQQRVACEDRMSALGQVAASVAHEVRNPLNAIEGFAALLVRDLSPDSRPRALAERTVNAARQLNCVVGNLLTYTREINTALRETNVNDLILAVTELVQPLADDKHVQLQTELPKGITAFIDPLLMKQALANLLTNAIEACPRDSGVVTITTASSVDAVTLTIADNGMGVPDEAAQQIFDPFFTMRDGGIGLGLSLCKRIIDSHDGQITLERAAAGGAEFRIRLHKSRPSADITKRRSGS